uniref:Rho GDP dissociation inhibitor (GDI) gamma n=1 Tax=Salarias fasciatus TaxID=181472 RepID=A0A672GE63_SALFA
CVCVCVCECGVLPITAARRYVICMRVCLMTDKNNLPIEEEEDEHNLNYNPPARKSLQEIQELDKDDESLVKYKQTLLGPETIMADLSGPNVRVTRLTLLCDDAPDSITMDLTGDLNALKEKNFSLQEGAKYRLKIHFQVRRTDIVSHRAVLRTQRITVKAVCMVGSYGPRAEEQEFLCPLDETPKGMMSRGQYQIKSCFVDDDKNVYLSWEWNLNVNKDLN